MFEVKKAWFPELKNLTILKTELEAEIFLSKIDLTPGNKAKLKKHKIVASLAEWRKQQTDELDAFFAVEHELPDHRNSDGYGCYKLFRYAAVRDKKNKVHLLRSYIELFYY